MLYTAEEGDQVDTRGVMIYPDGWVRPEAAFDGDFSQADYVGAYTSRLPGSGPDRWIGKWIGTPASPDQMRTVMRWQAFGSNDMGFHNPGNSGVTIALEYDLDGSLSWTQIDAFSYTDVAGGTTQLRTLSSQVAAVAWRVRHISGNGDFRMAELYLYMAPDGTHDASGTIISSPGYMRQAAVFDGLTSQNQGAAGYGYHSTPNPWVGMSWA